MSRTLGRWTLPKEPIGSGGNGEVYEVSDSDGNVGALKKLKRPNDQYRNERFRYEVEAMLNCQDLPGVLPILDYHLPDRPSKKDPAWLVTARATPLDEEISGLEMAIEICLAVAKTLAAMHARVISHRDVKPGNIFRYNGRWCLGDFGLADFPEKPDVTQAGRKLGPQFYIAPEMLNAPASADGCSADVYSLGKLFWKIATGQRYPLPGVNDRYTDATTISAYVDEKNSTELDALLEHMTQLDPDLRPNMSKFVSELEVWSAPPPVPSGPSDLTAFTTRAKSLVEMRINQESRRSSVQEAIDRERNRASEEYREALVNMETSLQKIGRVWIQQNVDRDAEFYRALTGEEHDGMSFFHFSVFTHIDTGECQGLLQSGITFGLRNVDDDPDSIHGVHAPVLAATGHLLTIHQTWGGATRSYPPKLIWRDRDRFVFGQPRESEVRKRFESGLSQSLNDAAESLLSGLEALKQPREAIAAFEILLNGKSFEVIVSEERHLNGLSTSRKNDERFQSDAEYVQHLLSSWAETRQVTEQDLQTVFDLMVESYAKQYLDTHN